MKGTQRSKSSKILSSVMVALFIMSNVQGFGVGVSRAEAAGLVDIGSIGTYEDKGQAGTIYFGSYYQNPVDSSHTISPYSAPEDFDNDPKVKKDWANKEGIQWRVLKNDTANNQMLLLSDKGLYADQFNSSDVTADKNVWSKSQVRATLNSGTDGTRSAEGFAKDAFKDGEWSAIDTTDVKGDDGTTTISQDKLFLLSQTDATNDDYGFNTSKTAGDSARQSGVTKFAGGVRIYGNELGAAADTGNCVWWLRSPGTGDYAYSADADGRVGGDTSGVQTRTIAVRPALNLNQESVLFASAAESKYTPTGGSETNTGKSNVNVDDGFALEQDYDGSKGWKLTVKDSNINGPTAFTITKNYTDNGVDTLAASKSQGATLDLSNGVQETLSNLKVNYTSGTYTSAEGSKNYISALVKKSGDSFYSNYAKIAEIANTSVVQTDEATVDISKLTNGATYTLSYFSETVHGDKETDYASDIKDSDTTFTVGEKKTVYKGTLGSTYAGKGFTAKLGNSFNLSFDGSGTSYDTSIILDETNSTGTITAGDGGTILSGTVTVNNGQSLTVANNFILNNTVTVNGTGTMNITGNTTINSAVAGTGTTKINTTGTVTANAKIATSAIEITSTSTLNASADKLGGAVTNDGTLELTGGTLAQVVNKSTAEYGTIDIQKATEIAAQINNQDIKLSGEYSTVTDSSYISDNSNKLTFNGGGFDFTDGKVSEYKFDAINLTGDGYLKLDVDLAKKEMDTLSATTVTGTSTLHITALTLLTEASDKSTEILFADDKLKSHVESDVTEDLQVGSNTQKYSAAYDKNTGKFTFTKLGASETTKAVSDTATMMSFSWINTVNNLQKRMGDLRGGEASNMAWARFQRNNDDVNVGRKESLSGNLYQLGYDFLIGSNNVANNYFGLSFDVFDGSQSFEIGGGDARSMTLSAYYTKIYESGHYFDFIFRYGRFESDTQSYDAGILTKLDYAMNGITLSGEYGYRANLGKSGLYLEPQAEFIYGYMSGAQATSSTNCLADIDSTNHFLTRFGLALGQRVKNFNYYLRGSYYHDFGGTTHVKYGDATYKQDGAQNWWELSLGGGWNISKLSYFYAELTKHFKDISNSLNFNLGFRFTL